MKLLKLVAISYLVKTILVGVAWLLIPDLPQRAATAARHTWAWVSQSDVSDASAASRIPAGREPVSR
jgi:hypothetical protein